MNIKPIRNKKDYNHALSMIEKLWDAEKGTEDFDHLEILSTLIDNYETQTIRVDLPDPIQAILFRMDQEGLEDKDMVEYFGSRSKVSEVLNYKRGLSINMIRRLHEGLGISPDVLIQEYQLKNDVA